MPTRSAPSPDGGAPAFEPLLTSEASAPRRGLELRSLVPTGCLLGIEGASVVLCLWALWHRDELKAFTQNNQLALADRRALLIGLGSGALAFVVAGALFLALFKDRSGPRLARIAARLAPLVLTGALPFFFHWELWLNRELTFCVTATAFGGVALGAFSAAFGVEGGQWAWFAYLRRKLGEGCQAVSGWLPFVLVLLGALGYGGYFSYHTIRHHRAVLTSSFDLGLEDNLLWNLVHGGSFMKMAPAFGPEGSHFGYHATLFAYVIAPFYAIYQRAETLLAFQSVMIGLAAIPLYLFAARRLGRYSACVVAFLYLLYPPVHGSNLYDFHYVPLGLFFVWLTLWAVDVGHFKTAALATILALSVREDVAADMVVAGIFLMVGSRHARAGFWVTLASGIYFVAMKMVIMPRFLNGGESFIHQWAGLIPEGAKGYAGVMMTVISNPVYTFTTLLEPEKYLYILQLGAPLLFFPWRRPIGYLFTIPGFFFTLLSTKYLPLVQISFQYTAHWSAFLLVAVVVNLEAVGKGRWPGDRMGIQRKLAWLVSIALLTLITTYQYGAVLQRNSVRGGFGPYRFEVTGQDKQRYERLQKLIGQIPPLATVSSSELVVPHVSNRPNAYTLRVGVFDADYILFQLPARGKEQAAAKAALGDDFGVVDSQSPFVLARRGHPKTKNRSVLRRLR